MILIYMTHVRFPITSSETIFDLNNTYKTLNIKKYITLPYFNFYIIKTLMLG